MAASEFSGGARSSGWRRVSHRPTGRGLTRIVGVAAALSFVACGKPEVSGRTLPALSERTGLPWQRVEVRLIRGNFMEQLPAVAEKFRKDAVDEARKRVLESAKAERGAKAEAAQRARAALAADGGTGAGTQEGPASIRGCMLRAEARLAAARPAYDKLMTQLAPRIAAVGVVADTPTVAVEQLRALVRAKVETEARQLRDEYLRTDLVQKSGTVLAAGVGTDRLCWSAENKRDVALRFQGPTVLYNGKPLPRSIAEQIWGLPPKDTPLRIPNVRAANEDMLLPGAQFETCFYARAANLPLTTIEAFGLPSQGVTRSGEWSVQWEEILMVNAPAADGPERPSKERHPPDAVPLATVFADRLRPVESGSEENRLIEALTNSESARAVKQAEAALLACHRAIELEKADQEVERVIQAIEGGNTSDFAVEVRVRPVLQAIARDPDRLSKWIDRAGVFMEGITVGRQEMPIGFPYQFKDVPPGPYTLLARPTNDAVMPKLWLIPVQIDGRVTKDLVAAAARDLTLRKTFENVWLGVGVSNR